MSTYPTPQNGPTKIAAEWPGGGQYAHHTPGPWVIDPCWDILGNTDDGNGMVCQITTEAVPLPEAEANARLIAAAPDLLAVLKECLPLFDMVTALDDHGSNALGQAENLIRSAIARATGVA